MAVTWEMVARLSAVDSGSVRASVREVATDACPDHTALVATLAAGESRDMDVPDDCVAAMVLASGAVTVTLDGASLAGITVLLVQKGVTTVSVTNAGAEAVTVEIICVASDES